MAPFEAALAMLEVEGNVAGAAAAATALDAGPHHAISAAEHAGARAVAEAVAGGHAAPDMGIRGAGAELQLSGVEQVRVRVCEKCVHACVYAAEHAGAHAVAEAIAGGHAAPDMGIGGAGAELQLSGVEQVRV